MSLVDNVKPIRKHQKVSKPAAKKSAMEYLERVGMTTKADLMPSDVGPGERKGFQ